VQPGATRIFADSGATRLAKFLTPETGAFQVHFLLEAPSFARKLSKKST
jgi:hypothetical protein